MTQFLVTPERAAVLRERLKEKFAERQAAKADFAVMCDRLATEPRWSFGDFTLWFEEIIRTMASWGRARASDRGFVLNADLARIGEGRRTGRSVLYLFSIIALTAATQRLFFPVLRLVGLADVLAIEATRAGQGAGGEVTSVIKTLPPVKRFAVCRCGCATRGAGLRWILALVLIAGRARLTCS